MPASHALRHAVFRNRVDRISSILRSVNSEVSTTMLRGLAAAFVLLFSLAIIPPAQAAQVNVWQGKITIPTYELGPADPNPAFQVTNPNGVYPYRMLDDLSDTRTPHVYSALYLENQYLKVTILPELGGRVYSLYDKVNQREVLYRNNVVKYGLVAPRGAWISGGIEFSFPYAHSMNTVSPVEWKIRHNPDGSGAVEVGAIDRVSNMFSEITLTLGRNAARLQEDVTLFNPTPQENLYLFWSNAAVKATDDLHYVYPMRETIDDDPFSIVGSWPVSNGIDKSWYRNDPEAMAIFGRAVHRDYFGVYYRDADDGVVHVADFRQNPGKKIWTWGTARSGRIWDKLLSDKDGPYSEIQSGRFSTQGYREFMKPRTVERWTEYWYPVSALKSEFVEASGEAALSVKISADNGEKPTVAVRICPVVEEGAATVVIRQGNTIVKTVRGVHLTPLQTTTYSAPVDSVQTAQRNLEVEVRSADGHTVLRWSASEPIDGDPNFTPQAGKRMESEIPQGAQTPVQALYLRAVFLHRCGNLPGALKAYGEVLQRDPEYIPALLRMAWYHYEAGDFDQANHSLEIALKRDRSNPETQYAAGVVARSQMRLDVATDAFWASIHFGGAPAPALIELGEIAIRMGKYAEAATLLKQAIAYSPEDALAFADLSVAERLSGRNSTALHAADRAFAIMPLLPYALAERHEARKASAVVDGAERNAHPEWAQILDSESENYLAVAAWYHSLGVWASADSAIRSGETEDPALSLSPLANYYLASDARHEGDPKAASLLESRAAAMSAANVFPNRLEDTVVLQEALEADPADAQAKYELGNFLFAHDRFKEAADLWSAAVKAGFENAVIDRNLAEYERHVTGNFARASAALSRAIELSPMQYRLYADLDEVYEAENKTAARENLFAKAPPEVLEHDTVRARHIIFLIERGHYDSALAELANHSFKPWEGGVSFHNLFVSANMKSGQRALTEHHAELAERYFREAMQFPENLGTGAPSLPNTSEQRYWLGIAFDAESNRSQAQMEWTNSARQGADSPGSCQVYSALSLRKLGEQDRVREMLLPCIANAKRPNASAGALLNGGLAEQSLGNKTEAREDFRKALAVDPLYWRAQIALDAVE